MSSTRLWSSRFACAFALMLCSTSWAASGVTTPQNSKEDALRSILNEAYAEDAPGACVIVVKDGQVLFRGARGMANVELSSPLQSQSVLRIGSVTKQFTAAAMLLLTGVVVVHAVLPKAIAS